MQLKGWWGDKKRLVGVGKYKQRYMIEIPQGRTFTLSNTEDRRKKKKSWWSGAVG